MTTRSNASCSGFKTLTLFVYIHSFFIMKPLFYLFLEILFLPGALAWAQPTPKETIPICSIWSPAWAYTKTTIALLGLQEQFNCNTAFSKKRKPLLNMNVLREPSITFLFFIQHFVHSLRKTTFWQQKFFYLNYLFFMKIPYKRHPFKILILQIFSLSKWESCFLKPVKDAKSLDKILDVFMKSAGSLSLKGQDQCSKPCSKFTGMTWPAPSNQQIIPKTMN